MYVPLGFVETGRRAGDLEARVLLRVRRSSVFLMAPRPPWPEPDYVAASDVAMSSPAVG
ncbi:hypothetical protein GCM10022295_00970 [Streptomyces osmaniensis]|uniref:Uncharacterized protein n=2 Tax=Streptomyces osmaniensis TaxID=593134 RepID=A0ABP6UZ37_9ACTN